jgi:hypothetical protein
MKEEKQIPVLEGWVSLPVVGKRLKVTRQRIFQMVDEGKLTTIHQLPGAGERPAAYVVRESEVKRLEAEQRAAIVGHDDAGTPLNAAGLAVDPATGKVPGAGTHRSYIAPEDLALTPAGAAAAQ